MINLISTDIKYYCIILGHIELSQEKERGFNFEPKKRAPRMFHIWPNHTCNQCSQNVDVNGRHHRCFDLIVSSSFNQPMAVERGRSHDLVGSMVGAVYVHVLRTLPAITETLLHSIDEDLDCPKEHFNVKFIDYHHAVITHFFLSFVLIFYLEIEFLLTIWL